MRGKSWIVIFIFSLALNVSFIATWLARSTNASGVSDDARSEAEKPRPSHLDFWLDLYREAGASEEQLVKIEPRLRDSHAKHKAEGETLKKRYRELFERIGAKEFDQAAIDRELEEIIEAHRRLLQLSIEGAIADRDILSEEQRAKLQEILRDRFKQASARSRGRALFCSLEGAWRG